MGKRGTRLSAQQCTRNAPRSKAAQNLSLRPRPKQATRRPRGRQLPPGRSGARCGQAIDPSSRRTAPPTRCIARPAPGGSVPHRCPADTRHRSHSPAATRARPRAGGQSATAATARRQGHGEQGALVKAQRVPVSPSCAASALWGGAAVRG